MIPDRNPVILMTARNDSRKVSSSQAGIHPRLPALLDRHRSTIWQQPLHPPTVEAFEQLQTCLGKTSGPLILDSGCGTGASTRLLAERFPDCTVIGVDKSAARLARGGATTFPRVENNEVLLRAELESFWRLAHSASWRLERHYLFYPNPWPKPAQLQRRWHAHPVFPVLLELGGRIEMRCNWKPYADEFAFALNQLSGSDVKLTALCIDVPASPFEKKYDASGHPLFSVVWPD